MTKQKLLEVSLETSDVQPFRVSYHPDLQPSLDMNLVLGNFHRFSSIISIKYSNVFLKCKTQLTEIKISSKERERKRRGGRVG